MPIAFAPSARPGTSIHSAPARTIWSGRPLRMPLRQLPLGLVGLDELVILVDIHVADAHAVADGIVVGLGELRPGEGGQIAVGGAVHEGLRVERLAAGAALDDDAPDPRAVHDRPGQQRVDEDLHARLDEHLERDELVEFRVDRGADRVVVVALEHLGVAGAAADLHEPVDDLLRNPLDHLPLRDAGERLPEIVEAVQRGAALGDRAAGIALDLDDGGLRPLPGRGDRRHDAARPGPCHDHIELPHRQLLHRLLIVLPAGTRTRRPRLPRRPGPNPHPHQQRTLRKLTSIHGFLLLMSLRWPRGTESRIPQGCSPFLRPEEHSSQMMQDSSSPSLARHVCPASIVRLQMSQCT